MAAKEIANASGIRFQSTAVDIDATNRTTEKRSEAYQGQIIL
jgi:hypothetical protein